MAKSKRVEQTAQPVQATQPATLVYCGPSIPGVAKQYTFYRGGVSKPLAEAIAKNPTIGELVIPLDRLPDAMRQLRTGTGTIYRLYRLVQKK